MIELLVERLAKIIVECEIRDSEINEWKFKYDMLCREKKEFERKYEAIKNICDEEEDEYIYD